MKNTTVQLTIIKRYSEESYLRVEIFPNSEIYFDTKYLNFPAALVDIEFLEEIVKYAKMSRDTNNNGE